MGNSEGDPDRADSPVVHGLQDCMATRGEEGIAMKCSTAALATFAIVAFGCGGDAMTAHGTQAPDVQVTEEGIEDAKADRSITTNDLTAKEAKNVLETIDSACSDAWCETDFGFQFKRIVCKMSTASCTLTMVLTQPEDGGSAWKACKIGGFSGYDSLIEQRTTPDGLDFLTTSFFDGVDACITLLEGFPPND
jgi:hypothetical protein